MRACGYDLCGRDFVGKKDFCGRSKGHHRLLKMCLLRYYHRLAGNRDAGRNSNPIPTDLRIEAG